MGNKIVKIYNSSKDAVLIKKIGLRVWSLRDEVKATVKSDISRNKISIDNPNLTSIIKEYTTGKIIVDVAGNEKEVPLSELANPAQTPPATEGVSLDADPDELAMAQAIAGDNKEEVAAPTLDNVVPFEIDQKKHVLQRIPVLAPDEIAIGRAMLSEINMDRMFFFCEKKFMEGQAIVIEFLVPKRFVLNAEVLYCVEFNLKSRIISKNKLPYRTIVKFTFLKEGERTLLRDFVKSISATVPLKEDAP